MKVGTLTEFRRDRPAHGIIVSRLWILAPLLLFFTIWAFCAPLSSASIAMGRIVLNSNRKTGMPVEAFLINRSRTMADYILTPFADAAFRAFREE